MVHSQKGIPAAKVGYRNHIHVLVWWERVGKAGDSDFRMESLEALSLS